ncbi:hypothetical protein EYY60_08760 [Flavobacterium zhairuonense]|uniref:hypothetical protein n=1 Tax=Flavobacterium zhairuonense TaxID=2493631 RepID=UPI00104C5D22|nr:hypothetical protein [Flavobacterium zhairuonense]KAF2511510.1 hypothetical protein EYY60_08760 [Flavobacterium zhairuonense]
MDADVVFTNENWIIDGVKQLQTKTIIQPFEYAVFLEKDEIRPSFAMDKIRESYLPNAINKKVWRSFSANFATTQYWKNENYNKHGHVGFAWGAQREILDAVPLFDKALIGGADYIIAHAAAGLLFNSNEISSNNVSEEVLWSFSFHKITEGKIGFVEGDLYHIWHGDLEKRQYKRRLEYSSKIKEIKDRDENGLFITNKADDAFIKNYFIHKEVQKIDKWTVLKKNVLRKKK